LLILPRGFRGGSEGLSRGFGGPYPMEPPGNPQATLRQPPMKSDQMKSKNRVVFLPEWGMECDFSFPYRSVYLR